MPTNNKRHIQAEYTFNVPFYDLDPMDVVWHGNYVKYFEEGRCALLKKIKYDYQDMKDSGYIWPIIDLRIKYIAPLTFMQSIMVTATLKDCENGLHIDYLITDSKTGKCLTKGYSKQVAITTVGHEMCLFSPAVLLQKIEDYYA